MCVCVEVVFQQKTFNNRQWFKILEVLFRLFGEGNDKETTNVQKDEECILDDAAEESKLELMYQDVCAIFNDNTGLEYHLPR